MSRLSEPVRAQVRLGAHILGRTPVGRVTIRLLELNHPLQVETRQRLIDAGVW